MPRKYMPEQIPANYLLHMNSFIEAMSHDERLKPAHVSLYITLFACWNKHFFVNPFVISRRVMMTASHIGSRDCYTQTLKELHTFGYIRYCPSAYLGGAAQVSVLPLRKAGFPVLADIPSPAESGSTDGVLRPETGTGPVPETAPGSPEKGTHTVPKTGPKNKHINNTNKKRGALPTHQGKNSGPDIPSGMDETVTFFREMRFADDQAPLFFYHYQANGWHQSNGLPIRNWKAAAEKWVLNIQKFKKNGNDDATGRLHTGQPRYTDPL